MAKVQLPKVEEKTRSELNIIKAQRMDKDLNETLECLIEDYKLVSQLQEQNNLFRRELVEANKKIGELEEK